MNGKFIISLDFELHWGIADICALDGKKEYFDATRESIPKVLSLFEKYGIHATWASVGFLFAHDKEQLLDFSRIERPNYENQVLSNYSIFDTVGADEKSDPYHFAPSFIQKIIDTPNQELGSHTFSHYYCNESGQTAAQFEADLKSAQEIAKQNFGVEMRSLVFPRNQINADYLSILAEKGFRTARSNPKQWFWKGNALHMRLARLLDTLLPIGNPPAFESEVVDGVLLLPANRFLRPINANEKLLQPLKWNRIKSEMKYAAKHKRAYHLWWHPHNFGYFTNENMAYLEKILNYYSELNKKYGFESASMIEMLKP
ncbi:MAG: polysaccharide deacetylase [Flavobacterium sp.]|uniref:polysaccharide deacetylase family protein n=1 Tax=Flavobacterium sp. TaxID=239 RepID=UPI0012043E65|nr:polysaccharide deacetylase family protein [Flavobacterium sp.]RZJ66058.1 MAG: polysaccharide deacetylase [Flavobacterium sp.]